jgi:M6 family metalloprotease-like protein
VAGWYTAAKPHDYYGENYNKQNDRWVGTLVREAVIAADAAGFDFAPYDQDLDGYVDQVAIVHQGIGEEVSRNTYDIWSHSYTLDYAYSAGCSDGGAYMTDDGVMVNAYIIMPELYNGTIMSTLGVFAHEYGHSLGLPDLYDTDGSSHGVGVWSIMAGGCWCYVTTGGDSPSHMDAWSKYALGWITPTLVTGTLANEPIQQAETSDDVYQLLSGSQSAGGEYFLVENRQKTGFDAGLPGAGLLIWHIDESILDPWGHATNTNECFPVGSPSCASTHYHVALMQADNLWELEQKINAGNEADAYPGSANNRSFGDSSSPASSLWSGSASGVSVTAISDSGPTMFATMSATEGATTTVQPSTTTTTAAMPNLAPYQPSGWSAPVVVSRTTGTNTDDANLSTTDTIYVDWAVLNDSAADITTAFD